MFWGICYRQSAKVIRSFGHLKRFELHTRSDRSCAWLSGCVAAYTNVSAGLTRSEKVVPITWYIYANSHLQNIGISQQTVNKNSCIQNGFSLCSSAEISSSIGMYKKDVPLIALHTKTRQHQDKTTPVDPCFYFVFKNMLFFPNVFLKVK